MSDGQAHDSYPLAFATVGSAGGRIRGNRYLIAPEWSPIANLWLGVAGMFDSPIEQVGESNAPVRADLSMPTRLQRAALALAISLAFVDASAGESLPPLVAAAKRGDQAAALALAKQGAAINEPEVDGTTALHWAVQSADRKLVAALLEAGAEPNVANRYGMTPQHLAAINGDAETLRMLLAAGADANATLPEGETVLLSAARTGSVEAINALVESGAKLDSRENWYGETPLIWAAAQNHAEAVRALLAHGADPDIRSAAQVWEKRRASQSVLPLGEWTPLFYAARENALDAGKTLIDGGANLNLADPDGATALVIAIINAHYEFAAMLLTAGADPNVVDTSGMGALYAAVDMHRLAVGHGRPNPRPVGLLGAPDIVKLLLERGANPNAALSKPIIQRQHTFGDFTLARGRDTVAARSEVRRHRARESARGRRRRRHARDARRRDGIDVRGGLRLAQRQPAGAVVRSGQRRGSHRDDRVPAGARLEPRRSGQGRQYGVARGHRRPRLRGDHHVSRERSSTPIRRSATRRIRTCSNSRRPSAAVKRSWRCSSRSASTIRPLTLPAQSATSRIQTRRDPGFTRIAPSSCVALEVHPQADVVAAPERVVVTR